MIDFIDKYYQKHNNLKVIGIAAASNQGYHIFTKKPLSEAGDLKGRKIRGTLQLPWRYPPARRFTGGVARRADLYLT